MHQQKILEESLRDGGGKTGEVDPDKLKSLLTDGSKTQLMGGLDGTGKGGL